MNDDSRRSTERDVPRLRIARGVCSLALVAALAACSDDPRPGVSSDAAVSSGRDATAAVDSATAPDGASADAGAPRDAAEVPVDAAVADSGVMACSSIPPGDRDVAQTIRQEDLPFGPDFSGLQGRHVLYQRNRYVGAGGMAQPEPGTRSAAIQFGATSYEMVFQDEVAGVTRTGSERGTWSVVGAMGDMDGTLTFDITCPAPRRVTHRFQSNGIALFLFPDDPMGEVLVFERRL